MRYERDITPGTTYVGGSKTQTRQPACQTCKRPFEKPRTREQEGLFWAVMREAYINWPESHPFKPRNEKHLYGYLLIEVRHCESTDIDLSGIPEGTSPAVITAIITATARAMLANKAARLHCIRGDFTPDGNYRVAIPLSTDRENCKKREFEKLSTDVFDVVEAITGVDIERMKLEAKRGHA